MKATVGNGQYARTYSDVATDGQWTGNVLLDDLASNNLGLTQAGQVVTIPELLGAGPGGFGGNYGTNFPGGLPQVLKHNLQENGAQLIMSLIVIPIAFKVGSSLLKKPRRQANALLRQVGVSGVKI